MQKIISIVTAVVVIFVISGCAGLPGANDAEYNATLDTLQERIAFLEGRNQELEARIGDLIADSQRYADAYQSATASVGESIANADGTAGSLENRIDRLIRYNQLLEILIQQRIDGKPRPETGDGGEE